MAWITKDKLAAPILKKFRTGAYTEAKTRERLKAIPPEPGLDFYFRDWEIDEAIKETRP